MKQRVRTVAPLSMLALLSLVASAQATTITFDSTITTSLPGQPTSFAPGLIDEYQPFLLNSIAFTTQGFNFGSFTAGVPNAPSGAAELAVVLDPAWCPPDNGSTCISDGTRYLAMAQAFGMFTTSLPSLFSISSFDASKLLADDGIVCPICNNGHGLENAALLRVYGFRAGAIVAQQTFTLSYGFHTYLLDNDPHWANVGRVVFQPLDANGNPGIADVNGCCYTAIDNIRADAVPEPASVALLGTGIATLVGRRWRRRR